MNKQKHVCFFLHIISSADIVFIPQSNTGCRSVIQLMSTHSGGGGGGRGRGRVWRRCPSAPARPPELAAGCGAWSERGGVSCEKRATGHREERASKQMTVETAAPPGLFFSHQGTVPARQHAAGRVLSASLASVRCRLTYGSQHAAQAEPPCSYCCLRSVALLRRPTLIRKEANIKNRQSSLHKSRKLSYRKVIEGGRNLVIVWMIRIFWLAKKGKKKEKRKKRSGWEWRLFQ